MMKNKSKLVPHVKMSIYDKNHRYFRGNIPFWFGMTKWNLDPYRDHLTK